MEYNVPDKRSEYQLTSATLTSGRTSEIMIPDLQNVISQFEVYEHISKPYITAKFFFVDHNNIIQGIDFNGGEKLSITLQHSEEKNSGFEINKEFLIDKIEKVMKTDERSEGIIIHCIEYHSFESSVQNINRSYSGSPPTIISNILQEYLDKEVAIIGDDVSQNLKVIVPNLHPIEAAQWLNKRAVTKDGLPFYFFSTFALNNLVLKDLGTMMSQSPINKQFPFLYAPSMHGGLDEYPKYYAIESFNISGIEDLYTLIRDGLVGANYQFYDTSTGLPTPVKFNVDDVFKMLTSEKLLGGSNARYVYGPGYKVKDKEIATYDSRVITQISSSGAYRDTQSFKSYNDETDVGNHRRKIVSASLQNFLAKSPIEINVRAREFLTGDENYTIGKTIRVVFLDNNTSDEAVTATLDTKKSGDYVICAAKHTFTGQRADTQLICGKLGYFGQEFEL